MIERTNNECWSLSIIVTVLMGLESNGAVVKLAKAAACKVAIHWFKSSRRLQYQEV